MVTRWDRGRAEVDAELNAGHLERVAPNREAAERWVEQARTHLSTARDVSHSDPSGAYALLYDASRKALAAILLTQGLRPTSRGGHITVRRVVRAQLVPPLGDVLAPFERLRRRRNDLEYGSNASLPVTTGEVNEEIGKADQIVSAALRVIPEMPVY